MMHPFTKVQQAMLEEEKWTTPSMTYFRPHFMMPPAGNVNEAHDTTTNGASASAYAKLQRDHASNPWWLNYDQALDLQSTQQNTVKPQHKAPPIVKHEQVDQARYGFDQINYSASQPSSLKTQKKTEEPVKFNCDQCEYQATQKSSLNRHKQTQHEGIKQPTAAQLAGKTYDCDICPYQATQLSSLKRHKMAKHSGNQYGCDLCEYIGTTAGNLRLHKRSKHEGVRFPCDMCGYEATQPGVLNRHKQQKHGFTPEKQPRVYNNANNSNNSGDGNAVVATKAPRDPNAPKRPLSGFFHFSNVGRAKVKAANPDFTVAEVSKELSRRWHNLDEVTKAMFEQMADQDKDRFQREKAEYQMSPKGGYKQTRAKKDPNAPKRPLCGFMCFSNDERANVRLEHPNFGVGEIGKELGRRWAAADPEVREKYNNMANEDKERFVKEKNEYEMAPRITYSGFRARKDPNAPKRNVAAFMWFSNDERAKISAENPGLTVGAIAKELSRRWALADPETKAKYDQMAYEDKQRYEKEKHEWHMKQRQEDMDEMEEEEASSPRMIRMDSSPTYTPNSSSQKWGQPQSSSSSNLGVTQVHPTSPPITINHHPTSPPITINHHHTPPPAVRYGY